MRSFLPSAPPGWARAKSCSSKPRASSKATARASPSASAAVVLAVGARFRGQASCATPASRCTSASLASVESGLPVTAMSFAPRAGEDQTERIEKTLVEPRYQAAHRIGLDREHLARKLEPGR